MLTITGKSGNPAIASSAEDTGAPVSDFWQQWQEHRDSLYRCCLKLMNFNAADAEDALSRAMLRAWEKVQKYAGTITNVKAWLMQLTRNFCIDIIRKRDRSAVGVEDIEWVGTGGEMETASGVETPDRVLEEEEKYAEIREAIAALSDTFRETFILHFYEERSHQEIAEIQGISYDNVCRRISLARKKLKEQLSSYFKEEKKERSPQSPPKKTKKSQPKEKEEKAIATSENVPHEAIENPPTAIVEESKESENEEVLETGREEVRSPLSSVAIADAVEEKESRKQLEKTGKTSVSTATRKKQKKPKPEKLKTSAIAILPSEPIPKEKKRSRLSFETIRLLSLKIEQKLIDGKDAIAHLETIYKINIKKVGWDGPAF